MRSLRAIAGSTLFLLATQPVLPQAAQPAQPPSSSQPQPSAKEAASRVLGNLEVLTDTQGVDFGPYLSRLLQAVRANWYAVIPEAARPPLLKRGKVSIQFVVLPNGRVSGLQLVGGSGDVSLDRAAWHGITASDPFAPLPNQFHGPYSGLRFHFYYNPQKSDLAE